MNNDEFKALMLEAFKVVPTEDFHYPLAPNQLRYLIDRAVEDEREACIKIIEEYEIPIGNSVAGQLARDWTFDALKEIRDAIRARTIK